MKKALKTLSRLYTERWLEIRHLKNSDENFDGEIAYKRIIVRRMIIFACCFLAFPLYFSATSLLYGGAFVTLVIIGVLLVLYIHHKDKYQESEELRQLREEWEVKRKLIKSVRGLNTSYGIDIMRKFEAEIGRLYVQYLMEKTLNRDMKYQLAIKRKARSIHEIAHYCRLPIKSFDIVFS